MSTNIEFKIKLNFQEHQLSSVFVLVSKYYCSITLITFFVLESDLLSGNILAYNKEI